MKALLVGGPAHGKRVDVHPMLNKYQVAVMVNSPCGWAKKQEQEIDDVPEIKTVIYYRLYKDVFLADTERMKEYVKAWLGS